MTGVIFASQRSSRISSISDLVARGNLALNAYVPVSATTLVVEFGALVAATAAAAGWSATAGGSPVTISSAAILGRYLTLTLSAPIALGAEVLLSFNAASSDLAVIGSGVPVESFAARPVRNLSWSGGAGWTPASLPSIVDYGIHSDWTRLKQDLAGTTAVTAANDPIGFWRGQLDTLTFTQATAGSKPKAAADGVYFLTSGTNKSLTTSFAADYDEPITLAQRVASYAGEVLFIAHAGGVSSPTSRLRFQSGLVRGLSTSSGYPTISAGDDRSLLLTTDNDTEGQYRAAYDDDVAMVVGTGTTNTTTLALFSSSSSATNSKSKGWIATRSHLTSDQRKAALHWLRSLT